MVTSEEFRAMLEKHQTVAVHDKIRRARVAIAGAGGLGSNIAVMLTRTGVGHLHIVDFDRVELSNLNRQHYRLEHIGAYKAEALKKQLAEINPYVEVVIDTVRVTPENVAALFASEDIICEAFDRPDQKAMLVDSVLALPDKKIICGSGMAGYGSSNRMRTRALNERLYLTGDGVSDSGELGLFAPRVMLCAAHEANMAVRLILGLGADD